MSLILVISGIYYGLCVILIFYKYRKKIKKCICRNSNNNDDIELQNLLDDYESYEDDLDNTIITTFDHREKKMTKIYNNKKVETTLI